MNPSQNKHLHTLLTATGLMVEKKNLVLSFSKGRSESSKDLTDTEAAELVSWLRTKQTIFINKNNDASNRMRRKIISMAHEMHWHILDPFPKGRRLVVDMARLNNWCKKFGYLHKNLNSYTSEELPILVTQFERAYKDYLNGI